METFGAQRIFMTIFAWFVSSSLNPSHQEKTNTNMLTSIAINSGTRLTFCSRKSSLKISKRKIYKIGFDAKKVQLKYNLEVDIEGEALVAALKSVKEVKLSKTLTALRLPSDGVEELVPLMGEGNRVIFVRDFYPNLFDQIRGSKNVLLIGNPGIGKSWFQMYLLYRYLNPNAGQLVPDYYDNTTPPKVILRQESNTKMTIFYTETGKVDYCTAFSGLHLCFDPKTTLYLFEPYESDDLRIPLTWLPTVATLAPDPIRYKEFDKQAIARTLFMPVWKFEDLKSAGAYLINEGLVSKTVKHLYSPESIRERFDEFGGISRVVLPAIDPSWPEQYRQEKVVANDKADPALLIKSSEIDTQEASHFLMHIFEVSPTFQISSFDFVNEKTFAAFEARCLETDLASRITCLIKNDETGFMDHAAAAIFETVVADRLVEGVRWEKTNAFETDKKTKWIPFELKLREKVRGEIPQYEDMKEDVLYVSLNKNYLFVDLLFKRDKIVYGIQVKRSVKGELKPKKIKEGPVDSFFKQTQIPKDNFKYILVGNPPTAENTKVTFEKPFQLDEVEIWKIPLKYERYPN